MGSPRWSWLLGGAVLAVAVVVAVVVVAATRGIDGPGEAAEEWAAAALSGDSARAAELECEGYDGGRLDLLGLTEIALPEEMEAMEIRTSSGARGTEWRVDLGWRDAEGAEREITVGVRREGDAYVVC